MSAKERIGASEFTLMWPPYSDAHHVIGCVMEIDTRRCLNAVDDVAGVCGARHLTLTTS